MSTTEVKAQTPVIKQISRFLKLPTEIRVIIYKNAFMYSKLLYWRGNWLWQPAFFSLLYGENTDFYQATPLIPSFRLSITLLPARRSQMPPHLYSHAAKYARRPPKSSMVSTPFISSRSKGIFGPHAAAPSGRS